MYVYIYMIYIYIYIYRYTYTRSAKGGALVRCQALDTNQDGVLTRAEFEAAPTGVPGGYTYESYIDPRIGSQERGQERSLWAVGEAEEINKQANMRLQVAETSA